MTRVSHLQLENDTIFFSRPCSEDLETLKIILLVFGLKINLDKSTRSDINIDQDHLTTLVLLLDCKASDWSIPYLSLPLVGRGLKVMCFLGIND